MSKSKAKDQLRCRYPKKVLEKLAERAKVKGEDRIEFALDQLKKMSIEDSEKDKEGREEETWHAGGACDKLGIKLNSDFRYVFVCGLFWRALCLKP